MLWNIRASFSAAILCLFLVACSIKGFAQSPWAWAKGVHTSAAEWANDAATDPLTGDIVVVGIFNSDLSAYYGSNFVNAVGGGFVAKYDSAGNVLWAFPIGNNQDDACNAVTVSPNGNIYVTGYLQNTADFKGTSLTPYVLNATGRGKEMYIAKYNTLGQLVWVNAGGGMSDDEGLSVCTNTTNLFVTGYYSNSGTFWGTSGGINTKSNQPNQNFFVTCYDANGNILWLSDGGSGQSCFGRDVAADNNNVYVTGDFKNGTLSIFDYLGNPAVSLPNSSPATEDAFVLSITTTGPFSWSKGIHSSNADYGRGIAQNASGVYITGSTSANATFPGYGSTVAIGAQGLDFFVAQVDRLSGNAAWVRSEPGPNNEEGNSIAVDTNNLICVAGYFQSTLSFSGGTTIASTGNEDVFVAGYSPAGAFSRVTQAGAIGVDIAHGISSYSNGSLYVCGQYENNAVFGSTVLTQDAPPNIFVAKISCSPLVNNTVAAAQTICANQTPAALNGSIPSGGSTPYTYLWQQSANNSTWSAASGTNNTINYSPPALSSNTYYRRVVISSNGCPGSSTSSSILINVDPQPTPSNAGSNQSLCSFTATLSANTPTTGTGSWSIVAGSGTVASVNSPNSTVSGLSTGQTILSWTISNGSCPPSVSNVTITVNAPPTVSNAGNSQSICTSTATLAANDPTSGTGSWSVLSGGGSVASVNSPTSTVSGLNIGQNILQWTISSGSCPSSSSIVTITVSAQPSISNAGSNQVICASTATLAATTPSVGTGAWSLVSGGGSVTSVNSPSTTATGLNPGTHVFMWTTTNGNCPTSASTVSVQVDAMPTSSNAGSDQNICASTATLSANVPSTGNGTWSVVSGSGSVDAINSPVSSVGNLSMGQNIFMWTIANGTCPSSSDTVSVFVNSLPTPANAGSDQKICMGSNAVMNATNPTVGNGKWTVLSGSGVFANQYAYNTTVSGLQTGTNVYIWTTANNICPSSSDTMQVIVYTNPTTANAGPGQSGYSTTATLNGNTPVNGTGTWSVVSGAGSFSNANSPNTQISGLDFGANIIRWTISNGVCPDSHNDMVITVNELNVPNGFSPNGDGVNDNFEIPGLTQFSTVKLEVFNRWGNPVYQNGEYKNDWNGKNNSGEELSDDTYFFILDVTEKKTYKGFVVLKRK